MKRACQSIQRRLSKPPDWQKMQVIVEEQFPAMHHVAHSCSGTNSSWRTTSAGSFNLQLPLSGPSLVAKPLILQLVHSHLSPQLNTSGCL
eukprot:1152462-Pelagomonas_calceolata.AAC.1